MLQINIWQIAVHYFLVTVDYLKCIL